MRICVIGSGVAGLTAAFALHGLDGADVTVFEQSPQLGGRADTDKNGEHCPRFFMDDYHELLAILSRIDGADGRSVRDSLQRVRRRSHTPSAGWVDISHLYRVLAPEIPWRDKAQALRQWRPSPLVADQFDSAVSGNRYGSLRHYSPAGLARMCRNLLRSRTAYVLPGSTRTHLVDPWVRHLEARGVDFATGTRVLGLRPGPGSGVLVRTKGGEEAYDAVVVTAFVPDLVALLDASGLFHRIVDHRNTHCVAYTMELDPRERLAPEPVLYGHLGINVLLQPEERRCVVLCTLTPRTDAAHVVPLVREFLGLEYPVVRVLTRPNRRPGEAVYVGDYLRPERILRRRLPGVFFAGSAIRNSYPIDSAEGAARSALAAVRELRRDFGLPAPGTAPGAGAAAARPRCAARTAALPEEAR